MDNLHHTALWTTLQAIWVHHTALYSYSHSTVCNLNTCHCTVLASNAHCTSISRGPTLHCTLNVHYSGIWICTSPLHRTALQCKSALPRQQSGFSHTAFFCDTPCTASNLNQVVYWVLYITSLPRQRSLRRNPLSTKTLYQLNEYWPFSGLRPLCTPATLCTVLKMCKKSRPFQWCLIFVEFRPSRHEFCGLRPLCTPGNTVHCVIFAAYGRCAPLPHCALCSKCAKNQDLSNDTSFDEIRPSIKTLRILRPTAAVHTRQHCALCSKCAKSQDLSNDTSFDQIRPSVQPLEAFKT